ncbi:MAG: ABC transporter permease subunit [Candidatus Cloacimonetes bacterium]|nr:ABC transporter permease subunit [Candidatus Cloacimonadota bacterium]
MKKVKNLNIACKWTILSIFYILLFTSCAKVESFEPQTDRDHTDFVGQRIGVITGSLMENTTLAIGGIPVFYNDTASGIEDVRQGRTSGFMWALTASKVMIENINQAESSHQIEIIPLPKEIYHIGIGGISMNQDVIDKFNIFLSDLKQQGVLEDIQDRWFSGIPDITTPMSDIFSPLPLPHGSDILRVAINSDAMPFVFSAANNTYSGYSIELMLRFGEYLEKTIEFIDMDFSALIPYIVSRRADIGFQAIGITEERRQSVIFTDPVWEDQHGLIVLSRNKEISYKDFAGKRIGIGIGFAAEEIIKNDLNAISVVYHDFTMSIEDVLRGKIDGSIWDLSAANALLKTHKNAEDLLNIPLPAEISLVPMGAISINQDIIERFNLFLREIKNDGTFDEIQSKWLGPDANYDAPMPEININPDEIVGTIILATHGGAVPFAFFGANRELRGYDIELVFRFAEHERLEVEIHDMDFSALVPYIISGRADLGIGSISYTEERMKSVIFTEPIYEDMLSIIILNPSKKIKREIKLVAFYTWIKTGVERNLITDNRYKMIIDGLKVTMLIALCAQLLGTIFGGFICYVLERKNRLIKKLGILYCGLINGTPMVVLLMITYYIIFGGTTLSNVFIAIMAFTMMTGATVAQIMKGAIETVDPVEIEAARSIGYSAFRAFIKVTLPQAVKRAIPSYTKGFVELVKATAIVGFIAIQDLTRAGDIIRSRTYDAYFPLLFIALIYLIVTTVCVIIFKYLIKKMNKAG